MKTKHIMHFISADGTCIDMDLCWFCKNLKDLHRSGDCEFYEEGYYENTCAGFEKVDDVGQRIEDVIACRSSEQ